MNLLIYAAGGSPKSAPYRMSCPFSAICADNADPPRPTPELPTRLVQTSGQYRGQRSATFASFDGNVRGPVASGVSPQSSVSLMRIAHTPARIGERGCAF